MTNKYPKIVYGSRKSANEVLVYLRRVVHAYGEATFEDVCQLSDIPSHFMWSRIVWDDLDAARVKRTWRGYVIKFPRPTHISK